MREHTKVSTGRLAMALTIAMAVMFVCVLALATPGQAIADDNLATQAGGTLTAEDFTITYVTYDDEFSEIRSAEEPSQVFTDFDIKPGWDVEIEATFKGDLDAMVGVEYVQMPEDIVNVGYKTFVVRLSLPYEDGYTGQSVDVTCGYTIEPRDVADDSVELWNEPPIYPYNVSASDLVWNADLFYKDYLTQGTDFEVIPPTTLVEGVNANKFTVKGKGNYTGEFQKSFSIGWDLDSDHVDMSVIGHGDEHHPIFSAAEMSNFQESPFLLEYYIQAEFDGETISSDDYEITMTTPDASGEGVITITAKEGGSVKGARSIPYTALLGVTEISNANTQIELECDSYLYTGSAIKPWIDRVYVTPNGASEPVDATFDIRSYGEISYQSNVSVGTGTLQITIDSDTYKGTISKTFKIVDPATVNSTWTIYYAAISKDADYDSATAGGIYYDVVPGGQLPKIEAEMGIWNDDAIDYIDRIFVDATGVEVTNVYDDAEMGTYGVKTCNIRIKGTGVVKEAACRFLYDGQAPAIPTSLSGATVTAANQTYTGKELKPAVKVVLDGKTLNAATDYDVAYTGNVNAGKATVTVTGKGSYTGSANGSFTIAKAANPFKLANAKRTVKLKKLKKKSQTVAGATVSANGQGGVTYAIQKVSKAKFKKKFSINKTTGKITVKKGTKKGTYKITVTATAAGNANYNSAARTAVVTIKVK